MKSAVELHDSECLEIRLGSNGKGIIELDAYVHRANGEPGITPGDGGVQRVRISMENMTMTGEVSSLPARIYDGSLALENSNHDNMVPLPLQSVGSSTLSLMLADDARMIHVSGKDLLVEEIGEFRFVERVDFSHRYPDA